MINWCYKWLPIIFGCHCRPDRSFFYKGKQFPVCARCTGMLAGILIAAIGYPVIHITYLPLLFLMLVPLIADGTLQKKTAYESTNFRRFITGIIFGYAIVTLIVMSLIGTYHLGFDFGMNLKDK